MSLVVHLMGTVRVVRDGQPVGIGGPKQQAVLAVLALSAGRRVSTDRLVDLVWDENPPASARRTVQSYVASLRRALGAGAALEPSQNGYTLGLDRGVVDLLAFEEQAAELLADVGLDPDDTAKGLADVLSTWEKPLDGLRSASRLEELTAPFEELRFQAVEGLVAAQIAGTGAGDAVRALEALVREHPTRENLWFELAKGLNQLGRRDAALGAIQRAREALREHLGVHPSSLLSDLETDLLVDHEATPARADEVAVPGNLPAQTTSFVGRDVEQREVSKLVRQHRLVTLTGVGGVGKTRLAVQVAAELTSEFDDGAWLVELANVGDPASVANAVATALGVRAQQGRSVTARVAEALAGRRLLVVLDNCEHVLDAAAELVEAILARSTTVSIVATSREGLRVGGEHLWVVPSFDMRDGASSAAVELFMERAGAGVAGFSLDDDADKEVVTEICRRLDGIALGIELTAARMVSMTPDEVLARLNDRVHPLSASQRRTERHQSLHNAVQWSYDLLTTDEQTVLHACAVFAGGFDIPAVTAVCDRFDEHTMLDVVDSLVRKSLVTTSRFRGRTRFGMLETIRQFSADQHAGQIDDHPDGVRDLRNRHARFFAEQAAAHWELWDGPQQIDAIDWVEAEFDNLRAGFFWAIDRDDVDTATVIAAHAMAIGFILQRFEPVDWAEKVLPAAAAAGVAQLPRLYLAASFCDFLGRSVDAVSYAEAASALQTDVHYQPFDVGWVRHREGLAHLLAGRVDRYLEICAALVPEPGLAHVTGLCGLMYGMPFAGRASEAIEIADEAMAAARAHGNPFWISTAHLGYGRAFAESDPLKALDVLHRGLAYSREHRTSHFEALIAREAAGLEAVHGDLHRALTLFAFTVDSFHRAGDTVNLASTFASLAVFFDWIEVPEIAATMFGTTINHPFASKIAGVTAAAAHLRLVLDIDTFDASVRSGAAMNLTESVRYAHHHINSAGQRTT